MKCFGAGAIQFLCRFQSHVSLRQNKIRKHDVYKTILLFSTIVAIWGLFL